MSGWESVPCRGGLFIIDERVCSRFDKNPDHFSHILGSQMQHVAMQVKT